jgi:hypothetical protein
VTYGERVNGRKAVSSVNNQVRQEIVEGKLIHQLAWWDLCMFVKSLLNLGDWRSVSRTFTEILTVLSSLCRPAEGVVRL